MPFVLLVKTQRAHVFRPNNAAFFRNWTPFLLIIPKHCWKCRGSASDSWQRTASAWRWSRFVCVPVISQGFRIYGKAKSFAVAVNQQPVGTIKTVHDSTGPHKIYPIHALHFKSQKYINRYHWLWGILLTDNGQSSVTIWHWVRASPVLINLILFQASRYLTHETFLFFSHCLCQRDSFSRRQLQRCRVHW